MRREIVFPVFSALFFGLTFWAFDPAIAQERVSAQGKPDFARVLALRQEHKTYSREDIEFMVRVVFADAMNPDEWINVWVRKNHIPSVTHLVILPVREGENLAFTVFTLPQWAGSRVVVVRGFQGNPLVRRWMTVGALAAYFQRLTTSQGEIRLFEGGFLGLKGIRMGMDLKNLLEELHARGLMWTEKEPPLSEEERRQNYAIRLALSRQLRG